MENSNIVIIDGMSLIYRAFYGVKFNMRSPKGIPTNAVYGFVKMIEPLICNAEYALVALDGRTKSFRHLAYKDYKATRKATPKELIQQFPIIEEYLTKRGVKFLSEEGYEADDVIAKIAKICESKNMKVKIFSSDRDLLQLVSNLTTVHLIKKSLNDIIIYNEKEFLKLTGVNKNQYIEYKTLVGDASDNIMGARGIGPKTAIKLLNTYGSIEGIYKNKHKIPPKLAKSLEDFKSFYKLSKMLVTITWDFPLKIKVDELKITPPNEVKLYGFLKNLGIKTFKLANDRQGIRSVKKPLPDLINITLDDFIYDEKYSNYYLFLFLDKEKYHFSNNKITDLIDQTSPNAILHFEDRVLVCNIKDLLLNKEFLKVLRGQNCLNINTSKEFFYFLYKLGIEFENIKFNDIYLAFYLLHPYLKPELKNIESIYASDFFLNNDILSRNKYIGGGNNLIRLSYYFVTAAARILKDLKKDKTINQLYENIEKPLTRVLAVMEYSGINVDLAFLKQQRITHMKKIQVIEEEIYHILDENKIIRINLSSPKQVAELLFDKLKLPKIHKRSTDVNVLEQLVFFHPIITLLLKYRKLKKILNTYIVPFLEKTTPMSRIHPYFHQMKTATGRLSTTNPSIQNIAIRNIEQKDFRRALNTKNKNTVLLSADYSQIELRILAHFSNDQKLIEAFQNDVDVHAMTAAVIFKKEITSITNGERQIAKRINFSVIYGMQAYSLSKELNISVNEANEFINEYYKTYKRIKEYQVETISFCQKNLFVKTFFGRKRFLYDINNSNHFIRQAAEREAVNFRIQGTQAEIIKKAMIKINNELVDKTNCQMIAQIHDGLIFEIESSEINILKQKIQTIMNTIINLVVPIKTTIKVAENWKNL